MQANDDLKVELDELWKELQELIDKPVHVDDIKAMSDRQRGNFVGKYASIAASAFILWKKALDNVQNREYRYAAEPTVENFDAFVEAGKLDSGAEYLYAESRSRHLMVVRVYVANGYHATGFTPKSRAFTPAKVGA